MQLNKFEREFKEQIIKQPAELDLDQSWNALSERLDNEHRPVKRKSGLGKWGFGVLLCLLLGYCTTGLWQDQESIGRLIASVTGSMPVENQIEYGATTLMALGQTDDFHRPLKTTSDISQGIGDVKAGPEANKQNIDLAPKINIKNTKNNETSLATSVVIEAGSSAALNSKTRRGLITKSSSSKPLQSTYSLTHLDMGVEKENSMHKATALSMPKTKSIRLSKSLVFLPIVSTRLAYQYEVEAPSIKQPIYVNKSERFGSIRSIRMGGGLSKIYGNYSSKNSELGSYIKQQNEQLKYLESINFSLSTNIFLARDFDIGLGIQFQEINQVLQFSRHSQAHRTLEDVVVEIRVNPYTQDSSNVLGDLHQTGQSFQSVRHYNAMTRWSVPLKLEYLNRQDRWGFGLAIGTSFSFSHVSRGRFIQTDGTVSNGQVKHPANVHFFSLEPIITYALRQPFVLDFRPHFQQAINNGAEVHSVLHRPQLWGLDVGIRYEWGAGADRPSAEPRF